MHPHHYMEGAHCNSVSVQGPLLYNDNKSVRNETRSGHDLHQTYRYSHICKIGYFHSEEKLSNLQPDRNKTLWMHLLHQYNFISSCSNNRFYRPILQLWLNFVEPINPAVKAGVSGFNLCLIWFNTCFSQSQGLMLIHASNKSFIAPRGTSLAVKWQSIDTITTIFYEQI